MTRKSCTVGMRNAIPRNHLKRFTITSYHKSSLKKNSLLASLSPKYLLSSFYPVYSRYIWGPLELQYRSKVSWQSLEARYSKLLYPLFSKTSRIEAQLTFEMFETVREFIESSFETFKREKQRTFRAINFWHLWIKALFQIFLPVDLFRVQVHDFSPNLFIRKSFTELLF